MNNLTGICGKEKRKGKRMSNRCKNCGGSLIYDITTKKIKCVHCESFFEPEMYGDTAAEEFVQDETAVNEFYDTTIYLCPNCGAEIATTELNALDYCMYCGSFATLESQMARVKRPERIIPFSKTAEECRKVYSQQVRKKIYAPKEFRDEKFLEGFKGIYIPFWDYGYTYGPQFQIKGEKESRHGDYIHKQQYDIDCEMTGMVDNIIYDASSTFDDQISARIAPYDRDHMKPFLTSYMFGFYGDTADIKADVYSADAADQADDVIWRTVTSNEKVAKGYPPVSTPKSFKKTINMKEKSILTMLPVWFLTWRKGDRVAYSVMNGDSGEFYTEIPVDIGRYLLFSLLTAVPLFFVFDLLFTVNAFDMLLLSIGLSVLMLVLYVAGLIKIVRRVMHSDDKGYLVLHNGNDKSESIKIRSICLDCLGAVFSIAAGGFILIMDPAPDYFYYFAAILCMLGVAFTAIRLVKRQNDLITRPVPHFFDRKGGENL